MSLKIFFNLNNWVILWQYFSYFQIFFIEPGSGSRFALWRAWAFICTVPQIQEKSFWLSRGGMLKLALQWRGAQVAISEHSGLSFGSGLCLSCHSQCCCWQAFPNTAGQGHHSLACLQSSAQLRGVHPASSSGMSTDFALRFQEDFKILSI